MIIKRRCTLWCFLWCFVISAGGCSRESQKTALQQQLSNNEVVGKPLLLATISDQDAPHIVDTATADKRTFYVDFSRSGGGAAYIANVAGTLHVVHNGRAGKPYQTIDNVRLSPDGLRVAYVVPCNGKQSLVADGSEGPLFDDIGAPVFSPDSRHIAYKARSGGQLHIVVDGKISDGYRVFNGAPVFNADSTKIAYSEGADENQPARLIVSDFSFKNKSIRESCGDQLVTNSENTRIAAVCVNNGRQRVIGLSFVQPQKVTEEPLYDSISHLTYAKDGITLSYAAEKGGASFLIFNNREEALPQKTVLAANPVVRPDKHGISVILSAVAENPQRNGPSGKAFLYQVVNGAGTKGIEYDIAEDLVFNTDGSLHAYAALKEKKWRIVANGIDGPLFDRVVGPMFSPDGKLLVYRARQEGKRFVVVATAENGKIIRQHRSFELVFSPVFIADGGSVAYGVKDGKELWWKVEKVK